uniref:Apple domain-containing protein n=1 Tax=Meloidogyne floridensis TaxID=298350 RepID=A0A915NBQ0_9BILA
MECLTDAVAKGTGVKDERVGDENLFPFTFSLPEEGFKKLVDSGLQTGAASECNKLCVEERSGKCLLSTDFAVAFGRRGDWMLYNVHILGEPRIWYCPSTKHKAESNSSIIVKFDPKAYSGWRVSSGHHCARENGLDYDKEEKYCHTEKSGSRFKQFGGSTPPGSKPTDGQTGPGGSSDPVVETTTSGPSGGAEASGSNMGLIIGIAIAVVVLLAVVGGLVWFFVLRGKGEEEEGMEMGMTGAGGTKTKTKVGGTTVGATQAKTGGMTTVGGTQAKTGGATTAGGATSKAAGTTKGGATSKAGGATSK